MVNLNAAEEEKQGCSQGCNARQADVEDDISAEEEVQLVAEEDGVELVAEKPATRIPYVTGQLCQMNGIFTLAHVTIL